MVEMNHDFEVTVQGLRPLFQRPPLPAHWELLQAMRGLEEYDDVLASILPVNGDQSLPCTVDQSPFEKDVGRYTIFLDDEPERLWRKLTNRFEMKLYINNHKKLGIEKGEMTSYIEQLIHHWRDAKTLRSEFVRRLHENRIPFQLAPCNRSWGLNDNLPLSDVIVVSENDQMRVKLLGDEFLATDYWEE